MTPRERVVRWWFHRRLTRGRCRYCGRVLPDDWRGDNICDDCWNEGVTHW